MVYGAVRCVVCLCAQEAVASWSTAVCMPATADVPLQRDGTVRVTVSPLRTLLRTARLMWR
jgi:hypothetical protein